MKTGNTWMIAAMAALMLSAVGCSDDDYAGSDDACAGESINIDAGDFCVAHQSVVVEEGFRCPAGMPHEFQFNDLLVCSSSPEMPGDDTLMEIYDTWEAQVPNTSSNNTSNNTLESACAAFCAHLEDCGLLTELEMESEASCVAGCPGDTTPDMEQSVLEALQCAAATECSVEAIRACAFNPNSDSREACINDNPGDACPGDPAPSVCASVESECAASGVDDVCASSEYITREAAACIAAAAGLTEGLEPWNITLLYNVRYERPIWTVQNTEESTADGGESGRAVDVNAVTGEVLGILGWASTP